MQTNLFTNLKGLRWHVLRNTERNGNRDIYKRDKRYVEMKLFTRENKRRMIKAFEIVKSSGSALIETSYYSTCVFL